MPHKFPAGLQAILASGWARSRPFVDIFLNNGAGPPLYLSTKSAPFGLAQYQSKLRATAGLRMSLTARVDKVELSAQNIDKQLGLDMLQVEDALTHAVCFFGKFIGNIRDLAEIYKVIQLPGEIVEAVGSEREVSFKVVRDVEAAIAVIGNQPVQRLCRLPYKGKGCESTDPTPSCLHTWIDCGTKAPAVRLVTIAPYIGNQPSYGGDALYAPERNTVITPEPPGTTRPPGGGVIGGPHDPGDINGPRLPRWPELDRPVLL